jgi:hypothetical protein
VFSLYRIVFLTLIVGGFSDAVFSLSDPTRPSQYEAATKKQSLRLESVFIGPGREVAVINGSVVTVGDSIAGVRVLKINKNAVKVSRGGVVSTIEIISTSIRQEK